MGLLPEVKVEISRAHQTTLAEAKKILDKLFPELPEHPPLKEKKREITNLKHSWQGNEIHFSLILVDNSMGRQEIKMNGTVTVDEKNIAAVVNLPFYFVLPFLKEDVKIFFNEVLDKYFGRSHC